MVTKLRKDMWLEKRGSKYRAWEYYRDPNTGDRKRVSVTIGSDDKLSVLKAEEELKAKILKLAFAVNPKTETLNSLVMAYRDDQTLTVRASTRERNVRASETLFRILGKNIPLTKLTAGYVRRKLLDTGKKLTTLNEYITRYKAIMRWGYRNGFLESIAETDKLQKFKVQPHRETIQDKFLTQEELKALLDSMKVPQWKLLTQLLALSGIRFGEASALLNSDIDLVNKVIRVNKTYDVLNDLVTPAKSFTSIREVYMQPELEKVVHEILEFSKQFKKDNGIKKNNLFMCDCDGNHIHHSAYNKYLKECCAKITKKHITPHALRHTHASLLLQNQIPVDVIGRRLGHGDNARVTREIYLHVTDTLKQIDNKQIHNVSIL